MLRKLLLGTALGTFAAIGSANAFLIDSFNNPTAPTQSTGDQSTVGTFGTTQYLTAGATDMGFDKRDLSLTILFAGGSDSRSTISNSETFPNPPPGPFGVFQHIQGNTNFSYSVVSWAQNALSPNIDLTDGGASSKFRMSVISADQSIGWQLVATDAQGDIAEVFFTSSFDVPSPGHPRPTDFFVEFAQFEANNANIDLDQIRTLTFVANLTNDATACAGQEYAPVTGNPGGGTASGLCSRVAVDTSVDLIETVPEPATMTLLGMGLAGLGLVARRRRNKAA